jgi:hypothetical protein
MRVFTVPTGSPSRARDLGLGQALVLGQPEHVAVRRAEGIECLVYHQAVQDLVGVIGLLRPPAAAGRAAPGESEQVAVADALAGVEAPGVAAQPHEALLHHLFGQPAVAQ